MDFKIRWSLVAVLALTGGAHGQTAKVDFARDIQPLFAKRCFKCHGPNKDEGGLRLSGRKSATAKLESGESAIVPGKPAASEILARLTSKEESERMPPEGKPLTAAEIKLIKTWIEQGAEYSAHWSFRQPIRHPAPKTKNSSWVRSPIDAFILARLEANGLTPAAPADRVSLIRRAYYDLIGLPPTSEQIKAFVNDKSANAFEKVIDELLKSPQYGEKWARHWLDLVRYAETNGYERDSRKELIWRYRDYVIRSFNEDKPYTRFIIEQLAGDELPDKSSDSITATGYYRLGIWDDEPADRPLARYDYLDDILRTTGEAFLGMTIGCARCHDHKIDPILQKDYYSMLSFFSDISPHGAGNRNHVPIANRADELKFKAQKEAKQKLEANYTRAIEAIEKEFLTKLKQKHPELKLGDAKPSKDKTAMVLPDSIKQGQEWEYTFRKPADNWFQIAFDDSKWKKGPGGFGTKGTPGSVVRTVWRRKEIWLRKDFGLTNLPGKLTLNIHHDEDAEVYLNGKQIATFKGYIGKYKEVDVTAAAADVLQTGRNTVAVHCRQTGGGQYIDIGLKADYSTTPLTVLAKKYGEEILGKDKLAEWQQNRKLLSRSLAQKLVFRKEFAMAVAEAGQQKTWILQRGNPNLKGDEVGPAFPQILTPPKAEVPVSYKTPATSGKRRVLAEWIASDRNPSTARVIVNRIWQHHFGRGIVPSTSDFGFQGRPPTHPQLLDWLATEFIRRGWRFKDFHKMIMLSSTYQMSSAGNKQALAKDPSNQLFWRYNMRRLTAEEIRDSILAVSGTLNLKMFGPAIYPPLPREVLATASRPNAAWGNSPPAEAARRSVYIHVKRSLRPPMLTNFDSPDPDTSCSARVSTTVPTQALGMLNSQFMNDQAKKLADRLQKTHPGKTTEQIATAIRLTTGRIAKADEIEADNKFIAALVSEEKVNAEEALRLYCLMILNTNEFVYLD